MKRRAAEDFFRKKVPGASRHEGARHTSYRICDRRGRVLIGNLTVSRGAAGEDLSLRNLKGLAEDLGLTLEGLVEASGCRIRATVVVVCAAAKVVETAHEMHQLDPIAYDNRMALALAASITTWLDEVEVEDGKISTRERKELERGLSRISDARADQRFSQICGRLDSFVSERLHLA